MKASFIYQPVLAFSSAVAARSREEELAQALALEAFVFQRGKKAVINSGRVTTLSGMHLSLTKFPFLTVKSIMLFMRHAQGRLHVGGHKHRPAYRDVKEKTQQMLNTVAKDSEMSDIVVFREQRAKSRFSIFTFHRYILATLVLVHFYLCQRKFI